MTKRVKSTRRGGVRNGLSAASALALGLAALVGACAGSPPDSSPPATVGDGGSSSSGGGRSADTPPPVSTPSRFPAPPRDDGGKLDFTLTGSTEFDAWRADFANRAIAQGRDPGAVYVLLEGIEPLPTFLSVESSRSGIADQAEFAKPIWEYLRTAVSDTRKTTGRNRVNGMTGFFDQLEAAHGVDREAVAAIWGMETSYGGFIGVDDAAETLASMAVEGRRRSFAEGELIALMKVLETGEAERADLISGWAGAMGQTQFMPTTYLAYGVDWTGDGKVDVWKSSEDALASAANYLKISGYRLDEPWGVEVSVPDGFDYSMADGQDRRISTWKASGLAPIRGGDFGVEDAAYAELWLPAGARGPKLLLLKNFDVFKTYNRADSYALAVGLLSDAIAGRPGLATPWPTDLRPLSVADVKVLQQTLNDLGYDAGPVDGIIGRRTRGALQEFQKDRGLPADGFPTTDALDLVRAAAAS